MGWLARINLYMCTKLLLSTEVKAIPHKLTLNSSKFYFVFSVYGIPFTFVVIVVVVVVVSDAAMVRYVSSFSPHNEILSAASLYTLIRHDELFE